MPHEHPDVLLICAMKDEYDQVLQVSEGQLDDWVELPEGPSGWTFARATFATTTGPLLIHATWATHMGREQTQAVASLFLRTLAPRCLAMSGICAGRRGSMSLGDVICADRLWSYDSGKTVVEDGRERFYGDMLQYRPPPSWINRMQSLRIEPDAPWLTARPSLPLEHQEMWVLQRLLAGQNPMSHGDRKTACPSWKEVIERLWKRGWLAHQKFEFTEMGKVEAELYTRLNPDGNPLPSDFRIHVAPIATGADVREDSGIFSRLSQSMRKVLGVEMEASGLAAIADLHNLPVLVVKAAADHGDIFKDDRYRTFAARASAECLIQLLRKGADLLPSRPEPRPPIEQKIFTHRLPRTSAVFIGRETELTLLESAWVHPRINVLGLIAWGGVGKTALMRSWLNRLERRGYDRAARVCAWSFYSQGAGERQFSAELFVDQMLRWLDDPEPEQGDPWQKGERLARLIRQQRTLLLLDGVEPLQHPPGEMFGRLRDPSLKVLLRALADQMDGLCVVSSRLPLTDLDGQVDGGYVPHTLDRLSNKAGADLLRRHGVRGEEDSLQAAADEYRGHALALQLLGSYLAMYEKGDVNRRITIRDLTQAEDGGALARRVMLAYERMFDPAPEGYWAKFERFFRRPPPDPHITLLRLIGLFDRPVDTDALAALREPPAIHGLTDGLLSQPQPTWKKAVEHLRKLGLLSDSEGEELDAHPLVREFFGTRLQETAPATWRMAQERLYRHFARVAPELPDTLEELEPLFRAVRHGCAAGRYQEVWDEVYHKRIARRELGHAVHRIGAISSDLAALASFFAQVWDEPHQSLKKGTRTLAMGMAGFRLRALGSLTEAKTIMEASLRSAVSQGDWTNTAVTCGNISELLLMSGQVQNAISRANEGIAQADRSGRFPLPIILRCTHANALHHFGELDLALSQFREAEMMQALHHPLIPQLLSLQSYQYSDLLLTRGDVDTVLQRVAQRPPLLKQHGALLGLALDDLILGRAAMHNPTVPGVTKATYHLDAAVTGLRKASRQDYLPLGLLARIALYRTTNRFDLARSDLAEAQSIAERGGMRLHLADCYLESARLSLAEGDKSAARYAFAIAHTEILAMEYHRRAPQLAELGTSLGSAGS